MSVNQRGSEKLRNAAVSTILKSLGEGTFEIIEQYLTNVYGMSVQEASKSLYSFEQLTEALNNLLGEKSAEMIFQQIILELDESTEMWNLIVKMKHKWDTCSKKKRGKG